MNPRRLLKRIRQKKVEEIQRLRLERVKKLGELEGIKAAIDALEEPEYPAPEDE